MAKDSRLINTEPHPTLRQVKPEKVSYLKDLSIIDGHASQFLEIAQKAKQKNFHLSLALGGDLPEDQKTNSVDLYPAQSNFKYPDSNFLYHANGFSKPWNTQVDINHLIKNYPNDRWKFYLSMDYQTPEQKEKIKLFLTELGKKCTEQKVSLLTKTEDHPYDNPDIYTWQPVTMAGILKDLYQDSRFTGIWSSVLHPFQRPIPGVSKDHVGLVQEPIYGFNGKSHSGRMVQLGETVTNLLPKYGSKFGTHIFIQACQIVGVMPSEPWRILEDNLPTNNKEIYQKFGIKTGS